MRTRLQLICTVVFGLGTVAAGPCLASTLTIFDGPTAIGSLDANVTSDGFESADFTLFSPYRGLMSDARGDQFRWLQVIYYDDEPVEYLGSVITTPSAAAHMGTVVDTPLGGWDYELPEGDDLKPFYESDTENNPVTGLPYAFPTLSYPDLHSADGVNPGVSSTSDAPGLGDPNHQTLFETYLAYVNPGLASAHTFDVLGGFAWGVQTDSAANEFGIGASSIPFSTIDPAKIAELQMALNRSGYTGADSWTVMAVSDFAPLVPTPEPGSVLLMLSGLMVLGYRKLS